MVTVVTFLVRRLHCTRGAQEVLFFNRLGVSTNKLDQISLTLLSGADWGRLQLGVSHWAIFVALLKYLIIDPIEWQTVVADSPLGAPVYLPYRRLNLPENLSPSRWS